jgi:hypothetical protein
MMAVVSRELFDLIFVQTIFHGKGCAYGRLTPTPMKQVDAILFTKSNILISVFKR